MPKLGPPALSEPSDTHRPIVAIIIAAIITVAAILMFATAGHAQSVCVGSWERNHTAALQQGWVEQEVRGDEKARLVRAVNAVEPVTDHQPAQVYIFRNPGVQHFVLAFRDGDCVLLLLRLNGQADVDKLLRQSGA